MSSVQEFLEALAPHLAFGDRVIKISRGALGGDSAFINFYTLPQAVYDRREGGGAEAENNRISFSVYPKGDKVQIENRVNHVGDFRDNKMWNLRKKTGTPEAIAKYLAAHINRIAAEVPPKFTHTR